MPNFFLLLLLIVAILPIVATVLAAIALFRVDTLQRETRLLHKALSRLRDPLEALGKRPSQPPAAGVEEAEPTRSQAPPQSGVLPKKSLSPSLHLPRAGSDRGLKATPTRPKLQGGQGRPWS